MDMQKIAKLTALALEDIHKDVINRSEALAENADIPVAVANLILATNLESSLRAMLLILGHKMGVDMEAILDDKTADYIRQVAETEEAMT